MAVCYNVLRTSPEELQKLAQAQCFGDTVAEQVDTDYRLDDCPVLTPGRATFLCKPEAEVIEDGRDTPPNGETSAI